MGEVRAGLGFLAAVALSDDALAADPGAAARLSAGAREAGVLVRPLLGGVAMSPPLICEQEHLELIAERDPRRPGRSSVPDRRRSVPALSGRALAAGACGRAARRRRHRERRRGDLQVVPERPVRHARAREHAREGVQRAPVEVADRLLGGAHRLELPPVRAPRSAW